MKSDHQPIQAQHEGPMRALAQVIDEVINEGIAVGGSKNGFALLVFPFGQPNDEHRANYISNANREDMLATMKEFIARCEGRYQDAPIAKWVCSQCGLKSGSLHDGPCPACGTGNHQERLV